MADPLKRCDSIRKAFSLFARTPVRQLLAILSITFIAATAVAKPREAERFNAWLDATWEEILVRRPILATSIGDPRYNDRIVDFTTAAWRADNRRFIERQLKELKGFNRTALSGQDRLSYDILKLELELGIQVRDWVAKESPLPAHRAREGAR